MAAGLFDVARDERSRATSSRRRSCPRRCCARWPATPASLRDDAHRIQVAVARRRRRGLATWATKRPSDSPSIPRSPTRTACRPPSRWRTSPTNSARRGQTLMDRFDEIEARFGVHADLPTLAARRRSRRTQRDRRRRPVDCAMTRRRPWVDLAVSEHLRSGHRLRGTRSRPTACCCDSESPGVWSYGRRAPNRS